eukprot:15366841-Ditylum_brightwellii.AAC.2
MAYPQAGIEFDLYMNLPHGVQMVDELRRTHVLKLLKIIYKQNIFASPNEEIMGIAFMVLRNENCKTKAETQIGQTAFKFLPTCNAANQEEKQRDKELFNVFKNSFHGGKAYNVITRSLKDDQGNTLPPSGQKVWQDFEKWCNPGGRKHTLIKPTQSELDALKLDRDKVDGFDYVHTHLLLYTELEHLGAKATDIK